MNNKQNLEKAQAILELIESSNRLIMQYNESLNRAIMNGFRTEFYTERYESMKAVKARLKKYYNNTIDKLTKYN